MQKETPDLPIEEEAIDLSLPPFHLGTDYESYKYFGAHPTEVDGVQGTRFRVWAPHAKSVSVINEVTGWDNFFPMERTEEDDSVWACFIPGVQDGHMYRYVDLFIDDETEIVDLDIPEKIDSIYAHSFENVLE